MSGVLDDYYRIRIRTRDDTGDLLVLTSVASATNPYIKEPPRGDGASFNPMNNDQMAGSYTCLVVDAITSGTDRVVTSKLQDVNGLLQLGYLKVYLENARVVDFSTTRTLLVGYLVLARLTDAITWELTIQGALRALDGVQLFSPSSGTLITDFLAQWPVRGCLFGGPTIGNFLKVKDLGGWVMRVRQGGGVVPSRTYWLDPITVYGPAKGLHAWKPTGLIAEIFTDMSFIQTINNALTKIATSGRPWLPSTAPFPALSTIADAYGPALNPWPGLVVLIDSGSGFAPWRPIQPGFGGADDSAQDGTDVVLSSKKQSGVFVFRDNQAALTVNSTVKVRCLTVLPSEISPVYLDAHPIDHLANFCALFGIGFNDALGVKNSLGSGLTESVRLTGPQSLGQLLRGLVFNLGIGVRSDSLGRLVPFEMCPKLSSTLPTKTITDALIVEGSAHLPFEQDVSTAGLQSIVFRQKVHFTLANAPDSVIEVDQSFTELNSDVNPLLAGALDIQIPGMLRPTPSTPDSVGQDFFGPRAKDRFTRFGRANQQAEFDLLRGDGTTDADTVDLGDEVLLAIAQLPSGNKRIGDDNSVSARCVQLIRVTENAASRPVRVSDSGPNAQPLATKPTHTIAASTDLPRTVAQVTITNAATLNGLGYAVRLQMAVVAHGASAPASTAYVDLSVSAPSATLTTAIRLPLVTAGSDVYIRARSELAGSRPSDWSVAVHVSLSLVDDPTSVVAAAVIGDGSISDVTWVIGANATFDTTDILVRLSADPLSAAVRVATVLAGSNRFRVQGLVKNTAYKITIQHRDPATNDVSDPVDASVTTDNSDATLEAPTAAIGFSEVGGAGDASPILTGVYGMAVQAEEFPSSIEFQEAVETGHLTDAYGAWSTIGVPPSVSDDFTVVTRTAPNDGLRRKMRARHIRNGLAIVASAWTPPVTVTPWTYSPLIQQEADVSLNNFKATDSADGLTRTFSMVAGSSIHRVAVFQRSLQTQGNVDGWPPVDNPTLLAAWYAAGGTMTVLTPDPTTGIVTLAVTKPDALHEIWIQFEPRLDDWSPGAIRRAVVQSAAPAMTATLKGSVTNGTADVSANVQAAPSDWPVQVDFYADDPFGSVLATKSISANATLDKTTTGLSALGALTLPLSEVRRFWIKLTNVAGQVWLSDPIAVDRDAIPKGWVTVTDYRAAPTIKVAYNDDTNSLVIKLPGAKQKTFSGLSGSGTVTYNVGDGGLDGGATVESALTFEETRAGYQVDIVGGGVTQTIWGDALTGTLHGQLHSAVPDASGSVDSNGAWSWSQDGPQAQDHVKYAESTSSYPSDGSAAAGTTISGRHVTRSGGTALTFGQTKYVTIISYDSGGVQIGPSIHLQLSYQTYTATKTVVFAAIAFTRDPSNDTSLVNFNSLASNVLSNKDLSPAGGGPSGGKVTSILLHPVLADGITVTGLAAEVYFSDGTPDAQPDGSILTVVFGRQVSHASTTIASVNTATSSGWQTKTASCSESTTGRTYTLLVVFQGNGIGAGTRGVGTGADAMGVGQISFTYTIPDPSKGL